MFHHPSIQEKRVVLRSIYGRTTEIDSRRQHLHYYVGDRLRLLCDPIVVVVVSIIVIFYTLTDGADLAPYFISCCSRSSEYY